MANQHTGPTVKNKAIRELLLEFPNSSKSNLGKIAFERHPHLFDNLDVIWQKKVIFGR